MESAESFHRVASVAPDDRDYYNVPPDDKNYYNVNVDVSDQSNYGKLSPAAIDNHTYAQINKTRRQ